MKKQLFILFVFAFFAGISSVNAQNCSPGALAPVAGVAYNYSVTISGTGYTSAGDYTWYVTTNTDLINGTPITPGTLFTTSSPYNTPTSGLNPFTLTWTSQAITSGDTYYLVVKFSQINSTATPPCTAMNMKVWQIKPINKFLLAINSFDESSVGQLGVYCAADITGAVINPGTDTTVTYTYGQNILYAKVIAKYFAGAWTPSFKIIGKQGSQSISSVTWDISPTGSFANTTSALNDSVYLSGINAISAYDGSLPIYVKIVIANNSFENLSDATIKIAIDGVIAGTVLKDVKSEFDCSPEADFGKSVNQTVKARPTVQSGIGSFINQTP
jgi:hypothetical protein